MTTYYNKTDGLSPTTRKLTGHNSRKTQSPLSLRPPYPPTYTHHTDGRQAQHNKGQDAQQFQALTPHIVCKITQRNNIRRANTCDPSLKLLNEEITPDIQTHKQTYGRNT